MTRCVLAHCLILLLALLITACGSTPVATPTATATPTPLPSPTASSTSTPTPTSTPSPTGTPSPTRTPTLSPTAAPTTVGPTTPTTASPTLPRSIVTPVGAATPAPRLPSATAVTLWQPGSQAADDRLSRHRAGLQGTLVERLLYSAALNRMMPYVVYLPSGYEASTRRYPVLYMLHGGGGHRDEWLGYELQFVADKAMRDGVIQPMIIMFPQGDTGYYANNAGSGPLWGDYIWRDLPRHMDAAYRTLPSSRSRAIAGNSMGGWGALSNSFLHPSVFSVVGAHSPSLPRDDGFRPVLGTGEEYRQHDPVTLAATAPSLNTLHIWIDTGRADTWLPRINELHDALAARAIAHRWEIVEGDHDYTYWMQRSIDYLRFYSTNLAGE